MDVDRASRTAVLICQGRAAAHGRIAGGRFADPTAMAVLRDDERGPVRWVRDGAVPEGWSARLEYEMVRAVSEGVVPRTLAMGVGHGGQEPLPVHRMAVLGRSSQTTVSARAQTRSRTAEAIYD